MPTPAGLPVAESIGVLPSPPLHMYDPQEYKKLPADKPDTPKKPFPLVEEHSTVPVVDITVLNYHQFMAMFLMAMASAAPKSFAKAIMQTIWHPPIQKELDNFIDNTYFQWVKDIGQRRMMVIWLFSFKFDLSLKARLVVNGKMCKPGIDYDHDETYCGNVAATSIKIFFALPALYGLTLRGGDFVGAYLVTPGSKDFLLCMATPEGIISPKGMVLQVSRNLYGLPSSGRWTLLSSSLAIRTHLTISSSFTSGSMVCQY